MAHSYTQLRQAMVDSQVRTTNVTELRLLDAMLSVPREAFVPDSQKPFAYIDEDILVHTAQDGVKRYLMEPSPFARLAQLAEIAPDHLVLDVGCGTGYSSAVLSHLAGAVIALEEDEELAELATSRLSEFGYDSVAVVTGPLVNGFAGEGPYDIIFVNGSVEHVPSALLDQLKSGGRLVVIEGKGLTASAMLYVKDDEGVIGSRKAFNAAVEPLPGFRREAEFVF